MAMMSRNIGIEGHFPRVAAEKEEKNKLEISNEVLVDRGGLRTTRRRLLVRRPARPHRRPNVWHCLRAQYEAKATNLDRIFKSMASPGRRDPGHHHKVSSLVESW